MASGEERGRSPPLVEEIPRSLDAAEETGKKRKEISGGEGYLSALRVGAGPWVLQFFRWLSGSRA